MKTITTVTTTAKGRVNYRFICNYCGAHNRKTATLSGVAIGGKKDELGALTDLQNEPNRYREKIREYEKRLRAGDNPVNGKYDALQYSMQSLLTLGLDGKCERCGKVQAWAVDPSPPDDMLKKGCLSVLVFDVIGLILFLLGAVAFRDPTLSTVFMVIGGAVFVCGIPGCMIAYLVRKRGYTKKKWAELAAEPNDPNKLPIIEG